VCSSDLPDDADLIRASRQGNKTAFGQLVLKYQDRLFNAVAYLAGNRQEAEDVVQEAFVQAYVKLPSFGGESQFFTWLYRIAFNSAVSRRRKKREVASVDTAREVKGEEPLDTSEGVGDRMLREERATCIRAALASLSEEHRAILVLREMEGYDYDGIAEILDLPVGTVRSRLHRARLQMRELLEQTMLNPAD